MFRLLFEPHAVALLIGMALLLWQCWRRKTDHEYLFLLSLVVMIIGIRLLAPHKAARYYSGLLGIVPVVTAWWIMELGRKVWFLRIILVMCLLSVIGLSLVKNLRPQQKREHVIPLARFLAEVSRREDGSGIPIMECVREGHRLAHYSKVPLHIKSFPQGKARDVFAEVRGELPVSFRATDELILLLDAREPSAKWHDLFVDYGLSYREIHLADPRLSRFRCFRLSKPQEYGGVAVPKSFAEDGHLTFPGFTQWNHPRRGAFPIPRGGWYYVTPTLDDGSAIVAGEGRELLFRYPQSRDTIIISPKHPIAGEAMPSWVEVVAGAPQKTLLSMEVYCYDEKGGWLGRHVFWQALTRDDGWLFYRVKIPAFLLKYRGQYAIRFEAVSSLFGLQRISLWQEQNSGIRNVW